MKFFWILGLLTLFVPSATIAQCPSPSGDQVSYGSGSWIGYVYDGADNFSTDYYGFINVTEMFDIFSTGVDSVTTSDCTLQKETFSVRFKMNQTFACNTYAITIGGDDGVRLSIDGGSTYAISGYVNQPYTTYTDTFLLDGNYDFVLEYFENSGNSQVSFSYVAVGSTSDGGIIADDQSECGSSGGTFDPAAFTSTVDAAFCVGSPTYQWQISSDNISFSDIGGAASSTYDPPSGFSYGDTRYYRRRAHSGTDTVYSNTVTIDSDSTQGDQVTYGSGSWIGYVYDGADNYSDYQGFVTESEMFDQSFVGSNTTYPINGCDINTQTFTVQYRMNQTFACGDYTITIGADDGVRLSIDGGSTYILDDYSNHAYRTVSTTVQLDGNYNFILEYFENGGDNRVTFDYTFAAVAGTGGDIDASQSFCGNVAVDPAAFTSVTAASFCSGGTPSYQWQESSDNVSFTDIGGATSITYDLTTFPVATTRYYRRAAIDGTDTVYSDTLSVVNDQVLGDETSFGSGSWIGYVYDGANNYSSVDYQGFVTENEIFDQDFGGSTATFAVNGCDVSATTFTVRYKMTQTFASGNYSLTIGGDDGVRLSVDGGSTYLIDGYVNQGYTTYNASTNLSGSVDLVLEYFENTGDNRVSFTYSLNSSTTWNGTNGTTWTDGGNWSAGVPDCTMDVLISSSASNMPILTSNATVRSIVIESGATLTISGSDTLFLCGDWNNQGTFNANSSTVSMTNQSTARTIQCSANQTFHNLDLNDDSGVTLSGSETQITGNVTISDGDFATAGLLTLLASASGTGSIGAIPTGHTVTGSIDCQQYISSTSGYSILGSPVEGTTLQTWNDDFYTSGFTGSDSATFPFVSIYSYDETALGDKDNNGWNGATNITNAVSTGTGRMVYIGSFSNVMFDAEGTINQGTVNFPITYTDDPGQAATQDGWNLVANPYPSVIDWESGAWTLSNVNDAVYVWRADISQFASYVSGSGTNGGSRYIPSSQGFWVQTFGSSPSMSSTESVKVDETATFYRTDPGQHVTLAVDGMNYTDETVVRFIPEATPDYDNEVDARKLASFDPNAATLSSWGSDSVQYSIQSHPLFDDSVRIPIQVWTPVAGTYNLEVKNTSIVHYDLVLEDLHTGQTWPLDDLPTVTFTSSDSTDTARFVIHGPGVEPNALEEAALLPQQLQVAPNPVRMGEGIRVGLSGFAIGEEVELQLYDIRGVIIHQQQLTTSSEDLNVSTLQLSGLSAGTYLLTAKTDSGLWHQKVVVSGR